MPVTARLSQKFYERFGDEITGEFVDWFNSVDSTYSQQVRELNDANREWFRAEMRAMETVLRSEMQGIENRLRTEFQVGLAQLEARVGEKIADLRSDMMKWMFIYWSGTVLSLGGLMIALLRR